MRMRLCSVCTSGVLAIATGCSGSVCGKAVTETPFVLSEIGVTS